MRFYKLFKKGENYFMKKKKFAATAVALAMATITAFSVGNTPSVKAADVTDKSAIDLEINGSSEEKKISTADSDVINKAFGYDSGTNSVLVCGENSKGYIDWNKSSIPHWKVYQTEVFTPVLSRDTEGNLVVKTDSNGKLATKENGLYGKQTVYAGYDDPSTFVYKISWGDNHFSPSQGGNKSDDGKYYYADNEINLNMGLKTYEFAAYDGLTYLGKQTQNIEDVYIVRVCYTADDKMNYTYTSSLQDRGEGGYDINGNYVDFSSDDAWAEYNKDRTLRYIDFWFLPEGVSTVLNYANGIQKDGDAWYYYKDGVVDTSYTGLAKYNGSWWYVKNGKIDFSATTLCKYNGTWWYVKNGKVDFGSTTLCKYNGSWWYVSGGKVNFGATGLCKYNGTWWYVKNGKVDFGSTTLCKYNGSWWYVSGGKVNFGATGLCKYNGTWWYVKNGKVSFTTTLCKYNGIWWYVNNGAVNFNKTTLVKYGSNWYAVAKGQVAWKYTGKLAYNGRYFNVVNGVVKF